MRRLKSIAAVFALLGVSVWFALGLAEFGLRLFPEMLSEEARLRLHWREVNAEDISEAHPYLGYLFPANHTGRIEREDGELSFSYTTDEYGFRNPTPWPERADIVVVGDSMAFGYGVEDDETWTALLAEQLPRRRIVNLGLVGAAPQQYLRIYETFGQALRPDLVMFCLFPGNDLAGAEQFDRWLRGGAPESYRSWQRFPSDGTIAVRSVRNVLKHSYLATFLLDARTGVVSSFDGRTINFADGGRLQLAPAIYARNEDLAQPDHPSFRLVVKAVEQTLALATQNGSESLVVLVPTKEEVYLPLLDEQPPVATAPFAEHFREARIPYLDLTPYFQSAAREGERLFFEVDGHPNAAGYRLMARVVFDHLHGDAQTYGSLLERRRAVAPASRSEPFGALTMG